MATKSKTSPPEPVDWLPDELAAGIILLDPLLFRLMFFADELTEEPSREQKLFICDESQRVFLCTARKIAKTVHEEAFVLQAGCTYQSLGMTEALFHTPNDVHLKPVITRLWERVDRTPLFGLLVSDRSMGDDITLSFYGGLKWYFRIEGWSGRDTNMVGLRAKFVVGDEGAFGNYVCHSSRLQTALPDARWLWAGVPNGVRSTPFYAIDADEKSHGWSRWKFDTYINPIYRNAEAKQRLIEDYGGEETQGYLNNVLGLWGEETVSSFPPGSLGILAMPYHIRVISAFKSDFDLETQLPLRLAIPAVKCDKFAIGWDYGRSPDPSVIMGAYTRENDVWRTAFRINLVRAMPQPHQLRVMDYILSHLFDGQFIGLSCDNQDAIDHLQSGKPLAEALKYFWSNPGGAHALVTEESNPDDNNQPRPMGRRGSIGNKEHYTVLIKEWSLAAAVGLVGRQLWLAEDDSDLTDELSGTTETKTLHGTTVYYPPVDASNFGRRPDHMTECLRYLCDAIQRGMLSFEQDNTESDILEALRNPWVGSTNGRASDYDDGPVKSWKAPWEK